MNQPSIQGPTGWSHDAAPGGTMMMDGMGQDILPAGPGAAAITRNPPSMGMGMGLGTNPPSPETRPPTGSDPTYAGEADYYAEPRSRKGFVMLAAGGAVAAVVLGGLVAWLLTSSEATETSSSTPQTAAATQKEPEPTPVDTKT